MKAAVIESFKQLMVIKEIADPELHDDFGAIVRVEANGICRTDWHEWIGDWDWIGLIPELPMVPGHEFCGVVEETGRSVIRYKKGDRVIVPFHMGCNHCNSCQAGQHNICDNFSMAGFHFNGGYGRYVHIPQADINMVTLPDSISFDNGAALGCRFMTAYHAVVRQGRVSPGQQVAVYGCGGIGLTAVHVASSLGARVIAVDIIDEHLQLARDLGAHETVNAKSDNPAEAVKELTHGGADVTVDGLGIGETCRNGVMSLRKGGTHVQVGLTSGEERGEVSLPIDMMVAMEITFRGSIGMPRSEYPHFLKHITANGNIEPTRLVTRKVSVEEAPQVLRSMTDYQTVGINIINSW